MTGHNPRPVRCAVYTRKSTEDGLLQEFNSLDAQYEACAAYALSQRHEGWTMVSERYDDGGFSGGNLERPALKRLLADVAAGRVDIILLYKIDRLTRSLADFAKIVEVLDKAGASFVSITQSFNTTTSMGRLTLNLVRRGWVAWHQLVTGPRSNNPVERSHLVRLARLRFLAPDVTAAIFEGRQPVELTARALLRCSELPIGWDDQRRALGFC